MTVTGVSVKDCVGTGVVLGSQCVATNAAIRRCEIAGNATGVRHNGYQDGHLLAYLGCDIWHTRPARPQFSHCIISNNTGNGVAVSGRGYCGPVFDNTLVVRNGGHGVYLYDYRANAAGGDAYLVYCTIADNGGTGVDTSADLNSSYAHIVNSVICGNLIGLKGSTWGPIAAACSVVSGNGTEVAGESVTRTGCSDASIDFAVAYGDRSAYYPLASSPACGLARSLTAADFVAEPADDLVGNPRRNRDRRRVAGCFTRRVPGLVILVH